MLAISIVPRRDVRIERIVATRMEERDNVWKTRENLTVGRIAAGHMFSRVLEIRNSLFVDIDRKNRFTLFFFSLSL